MFFFCGSSKDLDALSEKDLQFLVRLKSEVICVSVPLIHLHIFTLKMTLYVTYVKSIWLNSINRKYSQIKEQKHNSKAKTTVWYVLGSLYDEGVKKPEP